MPSWTSEARRFLESHRVGHLATADAGGTPHVVPICYAVADDGLYFVADLKPKRTPAHALKRLRNLRENARAAVVVDDYDDDWTRLAWLMVRGPAQVVDDAAVHAAALHALRARYWQYRDMPLDDPTLHPVVHVVCERVVLWRAS